MRILIVSVGMLVGMFSPGASAQAQQRYPVIVGCDPYYPAAYYPTPSYYPLYYSNTWGSSYNTYSGPAYYPARPSAYREPGEITINPTAGYGFRVNPYTGPNYWGGVPSLGSSEYSSERWRR